MERKVNKRVSEKCPDIKFSFYNDIRSVFFDKKL